MYIMSYIMKSGELNSVNFHELNDLVKFANKEEIDWERQYSYSIVKGTQIYPEFKRIMEIDGVVMIRREELKNKSSQS